MRVQEPDRSVHPPSTLRPLTISVVAAMALLTAGSAAAQLPIGPSTQFDITGFIQEAKLGGAGTGAGVGAHQGGSMTVNGHVIIVPSETIVILPAAAYTWQELFALAPAPYTNAATGMALADSPTPLTTYEAHVTGNRVGDVYIAGLVHIAQQDLNSGSGYINCMNYTIGEMRVGGVMGSCTTGTRVRINDPVGRFGRVMTPDPRFSVDDANPTIASGTGFPMCFPRVDPASAVPDALCPQGNRPPATPPAAGAAAVVQMNDPRAPGVSPTGVGPNVLPSAYFQAPLEVGDYVTFAGTLVTDAATPTTGPWPANGTAGTYVSAHTIIDNIAIYTWPGTDPAYVSIEVGLIGTGGLTVLGAGEAAIRTRFEGMATDTQRLIHLYGVDFNPVTGLTSDRDFGTVGVDPGAAGGVGAVQGRWRYRPPCTGTAATVSDKLCTPPPAGIYLPPPREVRAVIEGAWTPAGPQTTYANGIIAGQYHAPIGEYIFPENIPGSPIVENNFNTLAFLALGGYSSSAGTLVGQLDPWPSNVKPAAACTAPVANAGGPYTVATGGTVGLAGSATGTAPVTLSWTASSGTLTNATTATPTFNATNAVSPITVSLTATNACGSNTATATVTVNAVGLPTITSATATPNPAFTGTQVTLRATASGNPTAYTWTQTSPAAPVLALGGAATSATRTFVRTLANPVVSETYTFQVTARNAGGTSAPATVTVTINPLPDAITLVTEYRTSKQRLIITATSTVVSPNLVLTLKPYLTNTGTVFDPALLGNTLTNTGGGIYTLTLVGAPEPAVPPAAPLIVTSSIGGTSGPTQLQKIRQ